MIWIDISAVGMIPNVTIVTANPLTTQAPQVTHWTFNLIFIIWLYILIWHILTKLIILFLNSTRLFFSFLSIISFFDAPSSFPLFLSPSITSSFYAPLSFFLVLLFSLPSLLLRLFFFFQVSTVGESLKHTVPTVFSASFLFPLHAAIALGIFQDFTSLDHLIH